jgi:hypothetical protein
MYENSSNRFTGTHRDVLQHLTTIRLTEFVKEGGTGGKHPASRFRSPESAIGKATASPR